MFEINVLNTAKFKSLDYCVNAYRFGFNGKEKDDEIDGVTGSKLDFGARIYDSRIGRWLSVDPLQKDYPDLSPYNFVANNPILYLDPDGKKIFIYYTDENDENTAYEYGSAIDVPDNRFVEQAVATLDKIGSANSISEKFQYLKTTDEYNINIYSGNKDMARPTLGGPIDGKYIPSTNQRVEHNSNNNGTDDAKTESAIKLWHELGHVHNALDDPNGYSNRDDNEFEEGDENFKWDDEEEKFNIQTNEHPLSEEFGYEKRQGHNEQLRKKTNSDDNTETE